MNFVSDFDLTSRNTLGLPSRARLAAVVTDPAQLADTAAEAQRAGLPLRILGGGSNLVLHDAVDALVAVMATKGRSVSETADGQILVTAQAGEDWAEFVEYTVAQGFWGLENLAGIPGTVGAAPVQNIGAYGLELADRFHALTAWDLETGQLRRFNRAECQFAYRQSVFKHSGGRYVVLDVTFALPQPWTPVLGYADLQTLPADADAPTIMNHVLARRRAKLPDWRVLGNVGSFFHNPIVSAETAAGIAGAPRWPQENGIKLSAAWLIEQAGLKGIRLGHAGVYDKHALILVNHGGAAYGDIAALAALVKRTVHERFGVSLTQEPLEF